MSFRYVDYTGCNKSWTKLSIWSTHAIKQTMVLTISNLSFALVQSQFSSEYRSVVSIYSRGCLKCPHWTLTHPNMPETNSNQFKSKHVWSLNLNPSNRSQDPLYLDIFQHELLQSTPPPKKNKQLFSNSTYITKINMQIFPRQETNNSSETHHIWCDFFRPREAIMHRDSSCHYAGPKWMNWLITFCLTPIETQYLLAFGILPSGNSNKFNIPVRKSNIYFAGICKTYSWKIHDHIK